jgi:O-antigen/teichoic acid export membrane protein
VGLIAVIVSLAADAIGLGAAPLIGWKQWSGAALGVVIVCVGLWFLAVAASEPRADNRHK